MRQEARRQFVHMQFGSLFVVITALFGIHVAAGIIAVGLLIGALVSWEIKRGYRVFIFSEIVKRVEREHEKHLPGKGALMFFLGTLVLMLLFQDKTIVLGALCVAVYGDAASTIFGLRLGKHYLVDKKTLEGTLGGILASVVFLVILFEWWVALIATIVGMLAELLPLDDNFTIPIAAAITLTLLL